MITAAQVIAQIAYEIGGPVAAELGGGLAMVNWAGRHVYGMRGWSSSLRGSATLDYVAGQSWVALPTDFGELMYVREGGLAFRIVQLSELERYLGSGDAWRTGALSFEDGAYRLNLGHEPEDNADDALTVVYRRRWVDLTSDDDEIDVPVWMELLIRRVASAIARGLESGMVDEELARVESSPVYAAAVRADSMGGGTSFGYVPGTGAADADRSGGEFAYVRDQIQSWP